MVQWFNGKRSAFSYQLSALSRIQKAKQYRISNTQRVPESSMSKDLSRGGRYQSDPPGVKDAPLNKAAENMWRTLLAYFAVLA